MARLRLQVDGRRFNGGPGRGGGRKPGARNATPRRRGTKTISYRIDKFTPEIAAAALAAGDTPLDVLLATMRYYWHAARLKEPWDEKLLELASRAADRCIGFCHPRFIAHLRAPEGGGGVRLNVYTPDNGRLIAREEPLPAADTPLLVK